MASRDPQQQAHQGTAGGQGGEAGLREIARRFELLTENLDDVFWIVDGKTGRQLYVSPSYRRCWGFDEADLYAGTARWSGHIHAGDREAVAAAFARLHGETDGSGQFAVEYRLLLKSGETRWIRDRGFAVRADDGSIQQVVGIAEDITDRRTVVRTLRQREQRLQLAMTAARLHVWSLHASSRRLVMADDLCLMFGLDLQACKRLGPWRRRIEPRDRARVEQAIRQLIASGEPMHEEFRVRRADGVVTWLDVRAIVIQDEDNGEVEIHGVAQDITERRQLDQQLRDREQELRTITDAIPIGIARLDGDLSYQFANEAYAALVLGAAPDELVGRRMPDLVGEPAMATQRPWLTDALAGRPVEFEAQMALPGGNNFLRTSLIPERDESSQITGLVVVKENITARKRAETQLYEREREFKTLAENAPDVIARVDRRLGYLYVNAAAERAFGVVRERYVGRTAAALGFPAAYAEATTAAALGVFKSGVEQSADFSTQSPGVRGENQHFVARAVPEFDRAGVIESVLLIVYDVSDRVRAQIERDSLLAGEQKAREQAEAAARGRDEFLAIVSHELRSPLNGIQSWTQLLQKTLPDAGKITLRALSGIRTGVDQQVRLINDLLDATRIISGKLSLNFTAVKLVPVLDAALRSVRALADEKHVVLFREFELDGEESVDGDIDRLQQIVWNLLGNAIKFTPPGGHVWLKAWSSGQQLMVEVRDDGRGIAPGFLPRLFERFQRDATDNSRDQDGLGLGLMLVRHLTELHHGSVTAASAGPGQGATFSLALPRRTSAALPVARPAPEAALATDDTLRGLKVLLVDDHLESRDALAALLSQAGATVQVLGSGDEAIRLRQSDEAAADVLICDIAMPDKDGYQTLREIRLHEQQRALPRLPAIALTAFVQNDDRLRALDAGFDIHMSKPVDVEGLIGWLLATRMIERRL